MIVRAALAALFVLGKFVSSSPSYEAGASFCFLQYKTECRVPIFLEDVGINYIAPDKSVLSYEDFFGASRRQTSMLKFKRDDVVGTWPEHVGRCFLMEAPWGNQRNALLIRGPIVIEAINVGENIFCRAQSKVLYDYGALPNFANKSIDNDSFYQSISSKLAFGRLAQSNGLAFSGFKEPSGCPPKSESEDSDKQCREGVNCIVVGVKKLDVSESERAYESFRDHNNAGSDLAAILGFFTGLYGFGLAAYFVCRGKL